ncbi:hypothetical protein T484DRAFT_1979532, partial [Baffinella frigidus]
MRLAWGADNDNRSSSAAQLESSAELVYAEAPSQVAGLQDGLHAPGDGLHLSSHPPQRGAYGAGHPQIMMHGYPAPLAQPPTGGEPGGEHGPVMQEAHNLTPEAHNLIMQEARILTRAGSPTSELPPGGGEVSGPLGGSGLLLLPPPTLSADGRLLHVHNLDNIADVIPKERFLLKPGPDSDPECPQSQASWFTVQLSRSQIACCPNCNLRLLYPIVTQPLPHGVAHGERQEAGSADLDDRHLRVDHHHCLAYRV